MSEETEKAAFRDGAAVGVLGTSVVAMLAAIITHVAQDDPLHPILDQEAQVSPDKLADEIAKDPTLQLRWKAMREFVQSIDQQVGKNLEQNAGASKDTAQHWRDKATQPEASSGQKQAR